MSKLNPASARGALASLSLSLLLPSLGTSSTYIALPTLAETFSASLQQVQWVVLAYLLAITTVIVSAGRLGDMIGRRRLLLAGLVLFTASSLICGAAPALWMLVTGRAMQGLGAAIMMALTVAFVGDLVSPDRTGRAMGLLGTMSAIGTALGPSLGGLLIAAFGWRGIYLINVPLGCLAWLLAYRYLPMTREASSIQRTELDVKGTVLLALTIAACTLALMPGRGSFGPFNLILLAASGLGLILFVRTEASADSPVIELSAFRSRGLTASLALSTLVSMVMVATLVVGPFYLTRSLGLNSVFAGLAMSAGPIVAALTALPSGRAVDRFGTSRTILIGLVAIAAGCLTLAIVPTASGIVGYMTPILTITGGYALFQTANNTAVMKEVAAKRRGVMSSLLNLSRNLGLIAGSTGMGTIFSKAAAVEEIGTATPAAAASGMHSTFAAATVLMAGALVIGIRCGARHPNLTQGRQASTSSACADPASPPSSGAGHSIG